MPFALGRRNCVGQNLAQLQTKLGLATLMRAFEFENVTGKEDIDWDLKLVTCPINPLMKVKPR